MLRLLGAKKKAMIQAIIALKFRQNCFASPPIYILVWDDYGYDPKIMFSVYTLVRSGKKYLIKSRYETNANKNPVLTYNSFL